MPRLVLRQVVLNPRPIPGRRRGLRQGQKPPQARMTAFGPTPSHPSSAQAVGSGPGPQAPASPSLGCRALGSPRHPTPRGPSSLPGLLKVWLILQLLTHGQAPERCHTCSDTEIVLKPPPLWLWTGSGLWWRMRAQDRTKGAGWGCSAPGGNKTPKTTGRGTCSHTSSP